MANFYSRQSSDFVTKFSETVFELKYLTGKLFAKTGARSFFEKLAGVSSKQEDGNVATIAAWQTSTSGSHCISGENTRRIK